MRRKEKIFIILGFLLGSSVCFSNALTTLLLLVAVAICTFLSLCFLGASIYLGRKAIKWGIIGLLPILTAFSSSSIIGNYKHDKAEQIVSNLKLYKVHHGNYPKTLSDATTQTLHGLVYNPSIDQHNYRIKYLIDGFNKEYYDSEKEQWGTLGWSD